MAAWSHALSLFAGLWLFSTGVALMVYHGYCDTWEAEKEKTASNIRYVFGIGCILIGVLLTILGGYQLFRKGRGAASSYNYSGTGFY